MDAEVDLAPRERMVPLPGRGGAMAGLEFGRADRPLDLVFSHANGFNARTYRTILAPLAAEFRLLAIDLRGHGASTLPARVEGREGWNEFRDDLLALLQAEAERPVVLAGHSMGGTSSLLAAAEGPERVRGLVLFDPVIFPEAAQSDAVREETPLVRGALRRRADFESREAALEAYRGRGAFRTWSDAQLADYVAAGLREAPNGGVTLACAPEWEASNFRTHNYDPFDAFLRTTCPVRILKAEHGSTARVDGLQTGGPLRIETVAGASHFLPMERPDLVRQALRDMLLERACSDKACD